MLEDFHHLSQPQPKLVRRNLFNPSVIMNAVNQIDYILKTIPPPIKYQKYSQKQARQEYLNNLVLEVKKRQKNLDFLWKYPKQKHNFACSYSNFGMFIIYAWEKYPDLKTRYRNCKQDIVCKQITLILQRQKSHSFSGSFYLLRKAAGQEYRYSYFQNLNCKMLNYKVAFQFSSVASYEL